MEPERTVSTEHQRGASRTLLVVDDKAEEGELLGMRLATAGHQVHVVGSAREALASSGELRPDFALIDIGLPDLNGYELTRALRAKPGFERCRFIAVTGHSSERAIARGIDAGFAAYLIKPINLNELLALIAHS